MIERLDEAARKLVRPVAAAVLLAVTEAAIVLLNGRDLFLESVEPIHYAAAAATLLVVACLAAWALASALLRIAGAARPVPRPQPVGPVARRAGLAAAAVAGPATAVALWALSEGRRLRDLPGRPFLVALGGLSVAALLFWVVARLVRKARAGELRDLRAVSAFSAGVAVAALVADATLLRRLYPSLHWTLAAVSVSGALLAAATWPVRGRIRGAGAALALAAAAFVAAPFALSSLRGASNASYVVERTAPLTGKVVRVLRRARAEVSAGVAGVPDTSPPRAAEGVDLRDRSVLLVTVDALRADRISALGGDGLTPHIDALAAQGAVFRRAYTTTPHTSYAIGALFTGKYLRHVLDLPEAPSEHPTLAGLLGRAGYDTAAFYPPAIFFVDEERFASLAADGLGFEHREVEFAGAARRLEQVRAYLEGVGEEPLFLWVHFFEPHEPYEPPPRWARGDSAEERYDGEVAAVDEQVGRLVELFRTHRPDGVVVLTADHGEEHGEHGGHYHGTTLYDEQVRVPLVWSAPGAVPPGTYDVPVDLPDVATTLLAALGVPRDARMRGDDLGAVLAGQPDLGPTHAFGSIEDEHMVTDGRLKAICAVGDPTCRLYDLLRDPHERQNLGPSRPDDVQRLRGALAEHLASVPRVESDAAEGGAAEALARARVGDPTVAPDLVPLLGDADPAVRSSAARALARLSHAPALPVLARLREDDADAAVRAEAAVASVRLGDDTAIAAARVVVRDEALSADVRRRAALALGERGDAAGVRVLIALAEDEEADELMRADAVTALGDLGARQAVRPLIDMLDHLRLRIVAADALGRIGDRRAVGPLIAALEAEPYLPARAAEAEALARLGARRAEPVVRRLLGTPTPLPGGVSWLLSLGELDWPSGEGADLRSATRVREGSWECDEEGCRVGDDAVLALPRARAPRGEARAVFRVLASGDGAALVVDGRRQALRAGAQEVAFDAGTGEEPRRMTIRTEGDVRVVAVAVVEAVADPAE